MKKQNYELKQKITIAFDPRDKDDLFCLSLSLRNEDPKSKNVSINDVVVKACKEYAYKHENRQRINGFREMSGEKILPHERLVKKR